jgi:hypothetical protein
MNEVSGLTLAEASEALEMAPLEVLAWCTLEGLDCSTGLIDPGYIEVLRVTGHAALDADAEEDGQLAIEGVPSNVPSDPREGRLWVLRRVAGKLQRSGKWWPASIDLRAAARGVPDVGLARNAVEALERAGLVHGNVKAGVHRVGLVGERRAEIARLIERGEVADVRLTDWIA